MDANASVSDEGRRPFIIRDNGDIVDAIIDTSLWEPIPMYESIHSAVESAVDVSTGGILFEIENRLNRLELMIEEIRLHYESNHADFLSKDEFYEILTGERSK